MQEALEVVKNWMEMARLGRMKVGDRVLTSEECEIVRKVLNGVAGEIETERV
jgi:hypothetical protein